MRNTKKWSALLLAGILAITSLCGCGNNTNENTSTEASHSSVEENNTSAGNSTSSDTEKVVITMMFSGTTTEHDFETEILPALVEEHFPNVKLEVTKLPDDQYYTALKTKLSSGECPDMIRVQAKYAGANSVISLAEAGYLEPITNLEALKNVSESGKASYSYNNQVYVIPATVMILGTYYNKDMFEEHNLSIPTNWEEFLNCCRILKEAGIQPITMGDKDMYVMQFGLYQIAANQVYANNKSFDDELPTGVTQFTDEGTWDTVLEMYASLYDNGYIDSNSLGLGVQQANQMFIDGEAAMTFNISSQAAALQAEGAAEFERGFFPLPGNNEGEELYASMSMGGSPAIYSGSKNKEICKEILEWWFDGESELFQAYATSGRGIVTYGYGSDEINPIFEASMEIYRDNRTFYWCNQGWPSGVETEMQALFSELIGQQGTTIDAITSGMQAKYKELSDTE